MHLLHEAISKAMWVRRYDAKRITQYQYGRSSSTLNATERRHRAIICPILPQRMPWSSILV